MATLKSFVFSAVFVVFSLAWISESHAETYPYPFHLRKYFPAPCMAALRRSYPICKPQLTNSYLSLHVSISSECCNSIQEIEKECGSLTSIVFPRFNKRLVYLLLREYCGNKGGCQPTVPEPVVQAPEPISPAPGSSDGDSTSPPPEQGSDEPISPAPESSVGEPISPVPEPSSIESPTPVPSGDNESTSPVTEPIGEGPVAFPPVLVMPPDPGDYDPLVPSSPAFDYGPSPY